MDLILDLLILNRLSYTSHQIEHIQERSPHMPDFWISFRTSFRKISNELICRKEQVSIKVQYANKTGAIHYCRKV